ncbi:aldo/keto reductase [Flavimarina sp. Hel_I_48]|uniref:aldo/keto reductase n=1 Tax=Flavimarina sp. Hel_I_48 TaxID=1392488 RepID=UPI0004DFB003|nr:aldo/keto reductase [Flavimarina sp. Hel_I_48]
MNLKKLGRTSLEIPPIAFGGNVFGWTADKKMSFRLLDELLEKGFNYIDTANVYSRWVEGHEGGESETVIGQWMKERGNRDKMIIATKVGMDMGQGHVELSAEHIKKQMDQSLQRLQTDYVDVYFSHKHDDDTPIKETLATYNQLVNDGKVRYIGASNFPLAELMESLEHSKTKNIPRYEVYQPEYNLMRRDGFEGAVRDFCIENDISVTSYFTLGSGFLTGKYDAKEDSEGRAREKHVSKFFNKKGEQVLNTLKDIAQEHNSSQAAVAIAWTMAQPGITAPIASATKPEHLEAFYRAVKIDLNKDQLDRLDDASSSSD